MKYLAVILSIYIIALNLVPCEDNWIFDNVGTTEISQVIDDDHQHQNSDFCSPFCSCQCCQMTLSNIILADYNPNPIISSELFHSLEGLEKKFNTSILQPPQF